jgi:hypothetical protein
MKKIYLLLAVLTIFFVSYKKSYAASCASLSCSLPQICYCTSPNACGCVDPASLPTGGGAGGAGISTSSCTPSTGGTGVNTALGCIPTQPEGLVKWVLGWGITLGGGLAILLSLWGGVTIILAGGNPEKINEGKEMITSAISGLLFIIFSVFLLRFVGVNILGIL